MFGTLWITQCLRLVGWLVVLRINVDLAIFQPYLDLEAGDNQSLKIQVARPGIEPRSSYSANQELNHSATTAPSVSSKKVGIQYAIHVEELCSLSLYIKIIANRIMRVSKLNEN